MDVEMTIVFTGRDLLVDLLNGVATGGAIAYDLPLVAQRGLRVEIDTYMRQAAQLLRVQGMQPMHNHHLRRMHLLPSGKGPRLVVLNRLAHCLTMATPT